MKAAGVDLGKDGGKKVRLPSLGTGPQIVALLLILGLLGAMAIEPTRQLIEQRERINGMSNDLSQIQRSNQRLDGRIERLKDPDFLEQRARDIGLVRPGETAYVVMPPSRSRAKQDAAKKPARTAPPPQPGFIHGFLDFVGLL